MAEPQQSWSAEVPEQAAAPAAPAAPAIVVATLPRVPLPGSVDALAQQQHQEQLAAAGHQAEQLPPPGLTVAQLVPLPTAVPAPAPVAEPIAAVPEPEPAAPVLITAETLAASGYSSKLTAAPTAVGGVTRAFATDLADLAAQRARAEAAKEDVIYDASGEWWSPANALVVAIVALTIQLVSYYARNTLPVREAIGARLDQFDSLVGSIPLLGGIFGAAIAIILAATALCMVIAGAEKGAREPVLQIAASAIAGLSIVLGLLLGVLFGD